jgi:hypothetical protein
MASNNAIINKRYTGLGYVEFIKFKEYLSSQFLDHEAIVCNQGPDFIEMVYPTDRQSINRDKFIIIHHHIMTTCSEYLNDIVNQLVAAAAWWPKTHTTELAKLVVDQYFDVKGMCVAVANITDDIIAHNMPLVSDKHTNLAELTEYRRMYIFIVRSCIAFIESGQASVLFKARCAINRKYCLERMNNFSYTKSISPEKNVVL